jgi:hypothetical protein
VDGDMIRQHQKWWKQCSDCKTESGDPEGAGNQK